MLPWLVQFTIAFVLWFLYVGKLQPDEAVFGVVASAIAAFASRIVLEKDIAPLRAEWRAVAQIWRMPKYMVVGGWEIVAVLLKQIFLRKPAESLFYSVPFDTGGDSDEDAFRRALAVGYTTATPNFVIVGIDHAHRRLVYHQIQKSDVPEMTRRLGAKA
ncbi:MAG: Na+/H+ antiporter subunit E [Myxococcales bacterium]|nr:Na+/H+ antiporter subunit E [Myxococcales bacterium]